jgi:uncharacterized membrane protein HdeD (DUF308 family)
MALGALLILIGVGFYFGTGTRSPTALIPALLGILLGVSGVLALRERWRKHAMHSAVLLALVGLLGSARGLVQLPAMLAGAGVARPAAVVAQSITGLLCLVFIGLGVRSFVRARRSETR